MSKTATGLADADAAAAIDREKYFARGGAGIARPANVPPRDAKLTVGRTTRERAEAIISTDSVLSAGGMRDGK